MEAVLVGAGQRGFHIYGQWAVMNPNRLRFVAVADPDRARRERFAAVHGLTPADCFEDGREMLEGSARAEACFVASSDRNHHQPAIRGLLAGYEVLLEKPMAATLADAAAVTAAAEAAGGRLHLAHVLRYTPFFETLHDTVVSGRLGDLVTVEHRENIVAWHMAHSYVRGNWSRAESSAPMIVAKCCHDFDLLHWNLADEIVGLASFGSLFEFRPDRAPVGATPRCTDGCPVEDCPYDARRVYLDMSRTGWPVHVITDDLGLEARLEALRSGPYGRCAYQAGSDVVDHQVVTMQTSAGTSVTLVMHGHSDREERTMRYDGTRATLRGTFGREQRLTVSDHVTGNSEEIPIEARAGGHGGGDSGLIESFLASAESGDPPLTSASESLESHLLAFMAEAARVEGRAIDVSAARRDLESQVSNLKS